MIRRTRRRSVFGLLLAGSLGAGATIAWFPTTASAADKTYIVTARSQGASRTFNNSEDCAAPFRGATLDIQVGDIVRWHNCDDGISHTVTSDDGHSFDEILAPGASTPGIRFLSPGTYDYHCRIHPVMTGTIVVAGSGPATTAPPGRPTTTARPATTTTAPATTTTAKPATGTTLAAGATTTSTGPTTSTTAGATTSTTEETSTTTTEATTTTTRESALALGTSSSDSGTKRGPLLLAIAVVLVALAVTGTLAFMARRNRF